VTKEKCTGFPEHYQVGEGCRSDLPAESLEQTGALCSRYPTFLQASADIRFPFASASAETSYLRTDLTILADPNPGTRPWFETYSNLILKLQYSVTWSVTQ